MAGFDNFDVYALDAYEQERKIRDKEREERDEEEWRKKQAKLQRDRQLTLVLHRVNEAELAEIKAMIEKGLRLMRRDFTWVTQ